MEYLFKECYNLKEIEGLNNFKTNNVRIMNEMFRGCSNLISLNLSNFNPKNIEEIRQMFEGCSKLTYLDLSNFDTRYVKDMSGGIFKGCINLRFLNIKKFQTDLAHEVDEMFKRNNKSECNIILGDTYIIYILNDYNN